MDSSRNQLFVELLTAHQVRIRAYILSLVANFDDADDLMQDISKTMWIQFGRFSEGTSFLAWGFQIAHYRILEYRRRSKKQIALIDDTLIDDLSQDARQHIGNSEYILQHLYGCIRRLNAADRKILRMKYERNLKTKEISLLIGQPIHTVYRAFSRIHEILLSCIKRSMIQKETNDCG